jgi:hypothetical protein
MVEHHGDELTISNHSFVELKFNPHDFIAVEHRATGVAVGCAGCGCAGLDC